MALTRTTAKAQIAPGRIRHRIAIVGDACPPRTSAARAEFLSMMRTLADEGHHLLFSGFVVPDRVSVTHNGQAWQVNVEAEVAEEED